MSLLELLQGEMPGTALAAWRVLLSILILAVGYSVVAIVLRRLRRAYAKIGLDYRKQSPLGSLVVGLLVVAVLALSLVPLGLDLLSVVIVLATIALLFGIAGRDNLADLLAGVAIVYHKPFKTTDAVEIGGVVGRVEQFGPLAVALRTPDNRRILIPNSLVWKHPIVNHTAFKIRRIDMVIGIGYEDDVARAFEVIMEVLEGEPRVLKSPKPQVAVKELTNIAVNLDVRPWCKTADYAPLKKDLLMKIKEACEAEGIVLPHTVTDSPQF